MSKFKENFNFITNIFLLSILFLGGTIYAVGFHTANEILSGVFPGTYNFSGDVNFNGNVTGVSKSMVPGWPDVIVCNITNPNFGNSIFYPVHSPHIGGVYFYRLLTSSIDYGIRFNSDSTFNSYNNIVTSNCNFNISTLYTNGQAFNTVSN